MPNKNITKKQNSKTKSFAFYVNSLQKSLKKNKKKKTYKKYSKSKKNN